MPSGPPYDALYASPKALGKRSNACGAGQSAERPPRARARAGTLSSITLA